MPLRIELLSQINPQQASSPGSAKGAKGTGTADRFRGQALQNPGWTENQRCRKTRATKVLPISVEMPFSDAESDAERTGTANPGLHCHRIANGGWHRDGKPAGQGMQKGQALQTPDFIAIESPTVGGTETHCKPRKNHRWVAPGPRGQGCRKCMQQVGGTGVDNLNNSHSAQRDYPCSFRSGSATSNRKPKWTHARRTGSAD